MDNFFENRVYAITGATSGIGEAVAMELAKNGARVLALGRNEEKLKNLLANLEGENHSYRLFDSNRLETCEEAIKSGVEEMGKLSGFVHSAGIVYNMLLRDLDFDKLHEILQINLVCFFAFAKAACKMGRYEKGDMSVVGISSDCTNNTPPAQAAYTASKAALNATISTFSKEYANRKIRFNSVAPSFVQTNMALQFANEILGGNEYLNRLQEKMHLGVIMPNEAAEAVLFLLSNKTNKITNSSIKISGGI